MRRLNDAELDARIHKFLRRKFSEFPELAEAKTKSSNSWGVIGEPGKDARPEVG